MGDHARGIEIIETIGIETSMEGQALLEIMSLEAAQSLHTVVGITTLDITEEACTTVLVTTTGTTTRRTDENPTEAGLTGAAFLPGVTTSTPRGILKLVIKGTCMTVTTTRKRD